MSITERLQISNLEDGQGELVARSSHCIHFPSGDYELCALGLRLFTLWQDSQRRDTGGRIPPLWERPGTRKQEEDNYRFEHVRFQAQMVIRSAYIQHLTACSSGEEPPPDLLEVLTEVARTLALENVCASLHIPGPSLTAWYTRRGDPATMQDLYRQARTAKGSVKSC